MLLLNDTFYAKTFSIWIALGSLECFFSPTLGYSFILYVPAYTIISPYMFIIFLEIFLPTRLFRPTLVLGTLEYWPWTKVLSSDSSWFPGQTYWMHICCSIQQDRIDVFLRQLRERSRVHKWAFGTPFVFHSL